MIITFFDTARMAPEQGLGAVLDSFAIPGRVEENLRGLYNPAVLCRNPHRARMAQVLTIAPAAAGRKFLRLPVPAICIIELSCNPPIYSRALQYHKNVPMSPPSPVRGIPDIRNQNILAGKIQL